MSKVRKRRHIPQRTCVGCRQVLPKRTLIRIVRDASGIRVDLSGKAHGRGAYLHDQRSCWQSALNGALERALKADLTPTARQELLTYMERITDNQNG